MAKMYTNRVQDVNMIYVYTLCETASMGDMGDRLKAVRERAFKSARQAALKFNWPPSSYAAHENGQNDYGPDEAKKYAKAFKSNAAWLLTGEGHDEAGNIAKIMGYVGAGGDITPEYEQVPPEGLSEIEAPFPLPDDAIAFQVEGVSMWPRYDPGDVVIVRSRQGDPDALLGLEVAIRTSKGQRYLKRIVRGKARGLYDLESHNAEPIRNVRIEWVSEVHAVIRAGQWRKLDDTGKGKLLKRRAAG